MQIDVLSQNTLKLTLSRHDMFDLDINYESLSGKNPDTKRLLSNVLSSVKLDKNSGVDFSGERLFVEAFPRPDGGCMLYISCLAEENRKPERQERTVNSYSGSSGTGHSGGKIHRFHSSVAVKTAVRRKKPLLCRFGGVNELGGACAALARMTQSGRLKADSSLYGNGSEYRLFVSGEDRELTALLLREYGELIGDEYETAVTAEHFNLIIGENAAEKLNAVL